MLNQHQTLNDFCQVYNCKNTIKDDTCFENQQNPSCIDLIVSNRPKRARLYGCRNRFPRLS